MPILSLTTVYLLKESPIMKNCYLLLIYALSAHIALANDIPGNNLNCIDSIKAKHFEVAMQQCELETEEGNAAAAEMLGYLFLEGKGGPKDWGLAKRYLEQAVNLGNNNANRYLGVIYWNGLGVKTNHQLAHSYFSRCLSFSKGEDISCSVQYAKTLSATSNTLEDKIHALEIYEKLLENEAYEYSFNYAKLALALKYYQQAFEYAELFILWAKRYGDLASLRHIYIEAEQISAEAAKNLTDEMLTTGSNNVKNKIQQINHLANPNYKTVELQTRYKRSQKK